MADTQNAIAGPSTESRVHKMPPDPRRSRIVLSYWAMCVFHAEFHAALPSETCHSVLIGLPYWWSTTSIERHPLPTAEVASLAQQACPLELPILLDFQELQWSIAQRQDALDTLTARGLSMEAWKCLRFASATTRRESSLVFTIPASTKSVEELSSTLVPNTANSADGIDARVAKYSSRYRLVYSLLWQEAPIGSPESTWQIDEALSDHIYPVAAALAPLYNFTVETQIQHFAPLSIDFQQDEAGKPILDEDQLRAFVNSAEWNLASTATLDPSLHFILYVPKADQPLRIRLADGSMSGSNAFLSPQWGGIVILNADHAHLDAGDLTIPFKLFARQLETLLGVPTAVSDWSARINAMLRRTAAANARETVETLSAIVKLSNEIRNMRVAKSVGKGIEASISHLRLAQDAAQVGEIGDAYMHAARAHEHAEKAFFDPDMLALLYFPAEHVYAVYTPLFGPIAVPLILALKREWQAHRARRRSVPRLKME